MSRITSLTTEVLARMFKDRLPSKKANARSGMVGDIFSHGDIPHMGSGGAFMVDAIISGIHQDTRSFRTSKVCVDAGSKIATATPVTIQRLGGNSTKLLGNARIRVRIHGSERVYTCVIPPTFAANTGYDLLLGVLWLYDRKGKISVREGTISIHDGKEEIVISTGTFTPANLRVMFEVEGEGLPQC